MLSLLPAGSSDDNWFNGGGEVEGEGSMIQEGSK